MAGSPRTPRPAAPLGRGLRAVPGGAVRALGRFATATVQDWLDVLAGYQPARQRDSGQAVAERTAVLAILRGAMLDLLATGDEERVTAAVTRELAAYAQRDTY